MLGREVLGTGTGPPLVLVHGFTQTGRSWTPLAQRLARDRRVVLVDAPGHGRSVDERSDLWAAGGAVLEAAGKADLLGYSMGGRICLHAALVGPARVRRLILLGATAGIADPGVRAERRAADLALAETILRGGNSGLQTFLEEWLSGPLFAGLGPDAADLGDRLRNTAEGLASSLRLCGTGNQEPLDAHLGQLTMPVLLVVGQHDSKFRAEAERLHKGLPASEIAVVPNAGHACHLEQPDAFFAIVEAWLMKTEPVQV